MKNFKRMWRELFRLAGLTFGRDLGLTWHTIRHEFISRHIENTGDPVVTQRLARHKDNRTTQGICTPANHGCWPPLSGSTGKLAANVPRTVA
ncbi:MAG: hypothetical protein ABJC51_05045 [Acidobacteriota bacterium]